MNKSRQIIFEERQKFSPFWLLVTFLLVPVLLIVKYKDEAFDITGLFVPISVVVIISILFIFSKLETVISRDEIQYRLFPFHLNMRKISREEIADVFVRKYSPLLEYGGWGLRWGLNGKAINIRGNMGIQVVLKNGTRILIGTSNADAVQKALENFTVPPVS